MFRKKTFAAVFGTLLLAGALPHPLPAQTPQVQGEVKKIDQAAGKITIKHSPIPNLDMDSMTMVFRVKDPSMLTAVKVGDKIKFTADRMNGAITVTGIGK